MLLLFPSRFRHLMLIALGIAALVYGVVAHATGAEIIGGAALAWGLVRTARIVRGTQQPGARTHDLDR
jgi:threonine/homoserine/homoserine lactone efflux protein